MNLEEKVWNTCEQYQMVAAGSSVLVGLSGGADSVCLLLLLFRLSGKYDFSVCAFHMHHGIRGEEADRDRAYAKELCAKWGIQYYERLEDVPKYARTHKISHEEAGRILRYRHMRATAKKYGCDRIAVAHHGDDQIETVLMNLFRGSGSKGLCGMAPVSGELIRPLLFCTKNEIVQELEKNQISYCSDSTNAMDIYMRNRIRNQLLPWLEENVNAKAGQHVLQAAWQQRQIQEYMEERIEEAFVLMSKWNRNGELEIDKKKLGRMPGAIQSGVMRRALECTGGKIKDVSMVHIVQAVDMLRGRTGSIVDFPHFVRGRVGYEQIFFYKTNIKDVCGEKKSIDKKIDKNIVIHNIMKEIPLKRDLEENKKKNNRQNNKVVEIVLEQGRMSGEVYIPEAEAVFRYCEKKIQEKNVIFPENTYTKWLNCDKIRNSLQIRTRRSKDMIAVCKSGGHKKLKDFFIDCKIPAEKRDDILLLADGSEIIWVIGYRLSEAYKVVPGQDKVFQVELIMSPESQ